MWSAEEMVLADFRDCSCYYNRCSHCWRSCWGPYERFFRSNHYYESQLIIYLHHGADDLARRQQSVPTVRQDDLFPFAFVGASADDDNNSESDVMVDSPLSIVSFASDVSNNSTGGQSATNGPALRLYFQSAHGNVKESVYNGVLAPWQAAQ